MTTLSIKAFVFGVAFLGIASLNGWKRFQQALGFNRHMPNTDAFTLFWMISGSVLLCAQGFFDFTLFDLISKTMALCVYGLIGACSVWQASRQR
jgi:uncharacterized membrane protein